MAFVLRVWPSRYGYPSRYLFGRGPDGSLVLRRHRREPFVDELLQPPPFVGFGRVDVALRVHRNAVHGVELPGLTPAVAEARKNLERLAIHHVHLFVLAVGE